MNPKYQKRPNPDPQDKFLDRVEAHATKHKMGFNKALVAMAREDPQGFAEHRSKVNLAMMPQAEKELLAAQFARNLPTSQDLYTLRKLELFVEEIMTGEGCDFPQAMVVMAHDDPRSFGMYRKLKNKMVGN